MWVDSTWWRAALKLVEWAVQTLYNFTYETSATQFVVLAGEGKWKALLLEGMILISYLKTPDMKKSRQYDEPWYTHVSKPFRFFWIDVWPLIVLEKCPFYLNVLMYLFRVVHSALLYFKFISPALTSLLILNIMYLGFFCPLTSLASYLSVLCAFQRLLLPILFWHYVFYWFPQFLEYLVHLFKNKRIEGWVSSLKIALPTVLRKCNILIVLNS